MKYGTHNYRSFIFTLFVIGIFSFTYFGNTQTVNANYARGYSTTTQTVVNDGADFEIVNLRLKTFDQNGNFSTSTSKFTATTTGYYQVNAVIRWSSWEVNMGYYTVIYKNNTYYSYTKCSPSSASAFSSCGISDILYLNSGDTVSMWVYNDGTTSSNILNGGSNYTFLSIGLISIDENKIKNILDSNMSTTSDAIIQFGNNFIWLFAILIFIFGYVIMHKNLEK